MVTQSQLRTSVAEESGVAKKDVQAVLDALYNVVVDSLSSGDTVSINGIVKLAPAYVAAKKKRMGRNPQTGEDVLVSAKPASLTVRASVPKKIKMVAPGIKTKAAAEIVAKGKARAEAARERMAAQAA